MEFLVLGPLQVRTGGKTTEVRATKPRTLLGVLLVHANQVVSADRLLEEVWGDAQPKGGVKTLRYHISKLRDMLEPDRDKGDEGVVGTESGGYALRVEPDQVDASLFERLAGEGGQLLADGRFEVARERFAEALGLWRGGAFEEFRYDSFAQAEIARLEEMRLACLEDRISADLEAGAHKDAVAELRELTTEFPLRERLWGQLMVALYRTDQQADALRTFQKVRRHLSEELGIDPSRELQRLEEQILLQHPDLDSTSMRVGVVPNNLPAETNSFVSRGPELAELGQLLQEVRLVTLTGAGGTGKTRLALRAAAVLKGEFPDGIWLVELTGTREPSLVPQAVAAALEIATTGAATASGAVSDTLRGKSALLLLDNFEHVIEASPFVTELLQSASDLKVLVTSRERLRVSGEHVYEVSPLDVPAEEQSVGAESLEHYGATELFVERAQAIGAKLEATDEAAADIAAICRILDGLPLAIELAAARSLVLSPSALRKRLSSRLPMLSGGDRDRVDRHQTLRSTIDWSYRLLDEEQQRLFALLAVFSGGCSLESIETVCGTELALNPMEGVESLVNKSLLRVHQLAEGETRFEMLETIAEYAREQLDMFRDADEIHNRHSRFFAELAETAELELHHQNSDHWYRVLQREYGNLHAALEWSFGGGDPVLGCRIIASSHWFWWLDHFQDLETWTAAALAHLQSVDPSLRAHIFLNSGWLAFNRAQPVEAQQRWAQAQDWFRELTDRRYETLALMLVAMTYIGIEDEYDQAIGMARAALSIARTDNNKEAIGFALLVTGELARLHNDVELATSANEEVLNLSREIGDLRREATALHNLAALAGLRGDFETAGQLAGKGLRQALGRNDRLLAAYNLSALAAATVASRRYERGARLLAAADRGFEALGAPRQPTEEPGYQRTLATLREKLEPGKLDLLIAEGRTMSLEEAATYAFRDDTD